MDESLKKYEELYSLTKEGLAEEIERFKRIDDKASRYLSVVSVALVIFSVAIRPLTEIAAQLLGWPFWVLVTIVFVFISSTMIGIWLLFSVLRIQQLLKFPMSPELIDFVHKNSYVDMIFALSRGNISATLRNRAVTDRKTAKLTQAYKLMLVSIFALGALVLLVFLLALMRKFNLEF